jgi:hypothetical protein
MHSTATAVTRKVSIRFPNSIAPCIPSSPWGTYEESVHRGQVGQPRPDAVSRTAPPVTTISTLTTRLAIASGTRWGTRRSPARRSRSVRRSTVTPT